MVVRNSVTFSATQIDSQVDRSKALNYIRSGQHLLLPSVKMARHTYSVHHNWDFGFKCNTVNLETGSDDIDKIFGWS